MNVQKLLTAVGVLAAFAGESLFGQGTSATQLPAPSPFVHHHSSTELEGLGVGGGQFLQGLGLGSMYHAQGKLINELAREQRLKNNYQALKQQAALQYDYRQGVAQRIAETRAYNLAKQQARQQLVKKVDLSWPADLRREAFEPYRAALAEAVRQVTAGDGAGTINVRIHARKLVETVTELVRAGQMDPRSLSAAIRFESALNDYAAAVQASQLATVAQPQQGLAER